MHLILLFFATILTADYSLLLFYYAHLKSNDANKTADLIRLIRISTNNKLKEDQISNRLPKNTSLL